MVMAASGDDTAKRYGIGVNKLFPVSQYGRRSIAAGVTSASPTPRRAGFFTLPSRSDLLALLLQGRCSMPDRRRILGGLATTAIAAVVSRQAWAAASIKIDDASALLVIDVQNCFLPGGSLAVKDGEQVVPVINRIAKGFANVVMTQDWHTPGHISFASVHAGKKPFETIDLAYGKQVLWPDHCVQGTDGASLSKDLSIPQAALVIRKGFHKDVDSYSAFTEADGKTTTGLAAYLKARQIERLFVAGLATDFCVAWTALDARKAGFETYVVEDACRGIDTQGSLAKAWADMDKAGVKRIQSSDLAV
jgi:nicotinamidase/pyrazinamidase